MNKLARLAVSLQRAAAASGVAAQPQVGNCGPRAPKAAPCPGWARVAQSHRPLHDKERLRGLGARRPIGCRFGLVAPSSVDRMQRLPAEATRGAEGVPAGPCTRSRGPQPCTRGCPTLPQRCSLPADTASRRPLQVAAAWSAAKTFSAAHYATASGDQLADFLEHTTGPEREELEAKAKGIENPWHEAWCVRLWRAARLWEALPAAGRLGTARSIQYTGTSRHGQWQE